MATRALNHEQSALIFSGMARSVDCNEAIAVPPLSEGDSPREQFQPMIRAPRRCAGYTAPGLATARPGKGVMPESKLSKKPSGIPPWPVHHTS